jgi:TolB-like protein
MSPLLRAIAAAIAVALLVPPAAASDAPPAGPAAPRKKKLAVLQFRGLGTPAGEAELISEVVVTEASRYRGLEVISQSEVTALLSLEHEKAVLGCQDGSCIAEIGGALGADYLLVGSVGRLGETRRLDLSLMDARKVQALGRFGETVEEREDRLLPAVERGVRQLLEPVGGPPAGGGSAGRTLAMPARVEGPQREGNTRRITVAVAPGGELLVLSHRNFLPRCRPAPLPETRLLEKPSLGEVSFRPGDYVVPKRIWASDHSCGGLVLPGLGVYYRAPDQGPAVDHFRYDLHSGIRRPTVFHVEVEVLVR